MSEAEKRLLRLMAQRVEDDAHRLADILSVVATRYHLLYQDMALLLRLLDADLSDLPEDAGIDDLRARLAEPMVEGWKVEDEKKTQL